MKIDQKTVIKNVKAFAPAVVSTDATTAGEIIDTLGFESITFLLQGTITAGNITPLIEDGDDAALGDAAAVSDDFLIGTEAAAKLITTTTETAIGYVGKKRYVRLSAVSANSCNIVFACQALKGNPEVKPTV
jgi:hypothetical protein